MTEEHPIPSPRMKTVKQVCPGCPVLIRSGMAVTMEMKKSGHSMV